MSRNNVIWKFRQNIEIRMLSTQHKAARRCVIILIIILIKPSETSNKKKLRSIKTYRCRGKFFIFCTLNTKPMNRKNWKLLRNSVTTRRTAVIIWFFNKLNALSYEFDLLYKSHNIDTWFSCPWLRRNSQTLQCWNTNRCDGRAGEVRCATFDEKKYTIKNVSVIIWRNNLPVAW